MSEAAHKLDEVAGQLGDVRVIVARIDTKLDAMKDNHTDLVRRVDDHETRIRSLERTKWLLMGAAAAVGGVAGKIASLLG